VIFLRLFIVFIKIGLFTIGSGYSMLVLAQRYIVDTYKWLTIQEFSDLIAIAEITPGPIIVNLATFVGTKVGGLPGAFSATLGLITIPFLAIYFISLHYIKFRDYPVVQNLLKIARPMAIGFIAVAILKIMRVSIPDIKSAIIAIGVIILTYSFNINPIFIVIAGLLLGLLYKM
jgi:chromate transporter